MLVWTYYLPTYYYLPTTIPTTIIPTIIPVTTISCCKYHHSAAVTTITFSYQSNINSSSYRLTVSWNLQQHRRNIDMRVTAALPTVGRALASVGSQLYFSALPHVNKPFAYRLKR